jgi:hypothetical protein
MLPLYEGKMGHQFDHRFASFYGTGDTDIAANADHGPDSCVLPRNWLREDVAADRLARRSWGTRSALLGFRRVARNTDERTVVASLIPFGAASYGWILTTDSNGPSLASLEATYNSFAFDYVLRQFLSQPSVPQGVFGQLPTPPPDTLAGRARWSSDVSVAHWVGDRVVELTYTSNEMRLFANDLGDTGEPFVWDPERRFLLRCELDAAFFHLYGVARDDVDYIMDTFPIVKRKDEQRFEGDYRTKRVILQIYDAMARAMATGVPYQTRLDPPPGDPRAAHALERV